MTITIDIHALQTLPPSNINRDDVGAPKQAVFGGVIRQRVSSQAWKRAIRKDFERYLDRDQLALRTKRVVDLVAERMIELEGSWTLDRAQGAVEGVFAAAKIKLVDPQKTSKSDDDEDASSQRGKETGYLFFLSQQQIDRIARSLVDSDGAKPTTSEAKELLDQAHGVEIAMFGRMVADAANFNVDAAVQVAHAIGTHESEPEFDYFTAVDDVVEDAGEETGAGMIGTVQMMSSTLYRFASIDLSSLAENLGGEEPARIAAVAFVRSFVRSLPAGKLNTFANWTLPDLVYVTVRDDRAVSLVNAFESPVVPSNGMSRREASAIALASEAQGLAKAFGLDPRAAWVVGLDTLTAPFQEIAIESSLEGLLDALSTTLAGTTE